MKKMTALFLSMVMVMLTAVFTFGVSAEEITAAIIGDDFILPPHEGVTTTVQYTLVDETSKVIKADRWDITPSPRKPGDYSINEDGLLTITDIENQDFDQLVITAYVGQESPQKQVTVSKDRIFHDFEKYEAGKYITSTAASYGMRTTVASNSRAVPIQKETNGNQYISSKIGLQPLHSFADGYAFATVGTTLNIGSSKQPTGTVAYTDLITHNSTVITLEGRFRSGAVSLSANNFPGASANGWGVLYRQFPFYLVFLNAQKGTLGSNLTNSISFQPRVIDFRPNYASGGYVFASSTGKNDKTVITAPVASTGVINDDYKTVKSQPFCWGDITDINDLSQRSWINARVTLDFTNKTYSLWVEDILVFEDFALPQNAKYLGAWAIGCDADDLAIYSGRKAVQDNPVEDVTADFFYIWNGELKGSRTQAETQKERDAAGGMVLTNNTVETISAEAWLSNHTNEAKDIQLVMAYYNDGKLVKTAAVSKSLVANSVGSANNNCFEVSLVKPAEQLVNPQVKLFLWTADGLKPLTGQLTYTNTKAQ